VASKSGGLLAGEGGAGSGGLPQQSPTASTLDGPPIVLSIGPMTRYRIEAMRDVTVIASVFFMGSVELPPSISGQSQGKIPQRQNTEQKFKLKKGESREDIAYVSHLEGPGIFGVQFTHPEVIGESRDLGFLRVQLLET
jgi:hypothetical protein